MKHVGILLFLDAMTTTTSTDATSITTPTLTPTPIPAAVVFDGDPFTFFGSDKLAVRNNEA